MYYNIKPRLYTISTCIVVINIIYFLVLELSGASSSVEGMLSFGAARADLIFFDHQYFRLLSAMFMHFDIMHISGNMLILFLLGERLEHLIGKLNFIVLYLLCGIFSSVFSCIYDIYVNDMLVSAGASGAVFGVIGALIYILTVNKTRVEGLDLRSMIFMTVLMIYSGFSSSNVDNIAHISGGLIGFVLSMALYRPFRRDYI